MADTCYQGFCRPPKWDVAEGARLFANGMRVCDIARKLGVTYHTVYFYAQKYWTTAAVGRYKWEASV